MRTVQEEGDEGEGMRGIGEMREERRPLGKRLGRRKRESKQNLCEKHHSES